MRIASFFLLLILSNENVSAQKINFTDQNLKAVLIGKGYDFNKDNEIYIEEIDTVTVIDVSKSNIQSLDDLRHFRSLKEVNAMRNRITNLDVFFNNDVIQELYVGENQLGKKLTLKNIKNLTGLYAFRNGIEEIELINTDNIESLYLQGNLFESLEFKNLHSLRSLQLSENKLLKELDVSSNIKMQNLYLTLTAITKLDISNNPLIQFLYVEKGVEIIRSKIKPDLKPMPTFENVQPIQKK